MRLSGKILLFLSIFLFFANNVLPFESNEGKKVGKLDIIIVEGSDSIDAQNIKSRLKTKESSRFSQLIFDEDLKNLSKDFDRIEPTMNTKDDRLVISLKLWPKPYIKKIAFKGNQRVKTTTLKHELGIEEGSVFHRDKFLQALHKIKQYYLKRGYFESQITYSIASYEGLYNQVVATVHVKEGRSGHIGKIEFHGFTKKEESALLDMIYTKKYNFLFSWLTGQGNYNEDALEQDHITILNYLHNKGYADAKVDIKLLDDKASNKMVIDVTAHRGPKYYFGNVAFSGNSLIANNKIENILLSHSKEVYSPEKIRDTAQSIKDLYGRRGYIESEVTYETHLKEDEPVYDVSYRIEEGQCFRVGMIRVFGNTQTNTNVILRESLLIPGERFDSRKLKATQTRLENIGYFKNVNVYAVRASDDFSLGPNYRDVHIEVEEAPTASASASVGLSSLKDVFGVLELTERNFNSSGFLHLGSEGISALRGGGEYAHIKGTYGEKEQSVLVSWMTPYLRDSLWRLGFEVSYTRSRIQSREYMISTYGGSLFTSYPITNYWTYGAKYRVRNADIDIDQDAGQQAQQQEKNSGIISAISTSMSYDSTDNARKAHRGIRSAFETELAGIGGDSTFLKFSYVNSVYVPLWTRCTLKGRMDYHFMEPMGQTDFSEVPLSERFFLGGDTTVRGYKPYIIGPRFENPNDPNNRSNPTGGISSALFSLELSQELHRMVDAFIFIDAGSVSNKHFTIDTINGSYGIGLRVDLMQRLPLTGGLCLPINADNKEDFTNYFFSMTGIF